MLLLNSAILDKYLHCMELIYQLYECVESVRYKQHLRIGLFYDVCEFIFTPYDFLCVLLWNSGRNSE